MSAVNQVCIKTHTYQHKPMRKIKVTNCNHQADDPFYVCGLMSACVICKQILTLTVLVTTIDAQWEGMGDVGLARYEPALLPPCLTIRV